MGVYFAPAFLSTVRGAFSVSTRGTPARTDTSAAEQHHQASVAAIPILAQGGAVWAAAFSSDSISGVPSPGIAMAGHAPQAGEREVISQYTGIVGGGAVE